MRRHQPRRRRRVKGSDGSKTTVLSRNPVAIPAKQPITKDGIHAWSSCCWGMITRWLARSARSRSRWRAVRPSGGRTGTLGDEIYAAPLRLSRTRLARADAPDPPSLPLSALPCLRSPVPSRRPSILASVRENSNFSSSVPPSEGDETGTSHFRAARAPTRLVPATWFGAERLFSWTPLSGATLCLAQNMYLRGGAAQRLKTRVLTETCNLPCMQRMRARKLPSA